jgi:hypothetical protein
MNNAQLNWSPLEKTAFRFFFAFFILLILPLDPYFFSSSFSGGTDFFFGMFALANYVPAFISRDAGMQCVDLLFIGGLSFIITLFWSWKQAAAPNYINLFHFLRAVLRYKLAAVLLVYAFIKIFPLQVPYPTLSELNTQYGDFTPAKIFELTVGVAKANYQQAIGLAELAAALLLIFRRTATLGAITAAGLQLNVVLAAFAYKTGDQLYSSYLFLIAIFILAYDLPRIYRLLMEKPVLPNQQKLALKDGWQKKARLYFKAFFLIFGCFYAISAYSKYQEGSYALPQTATLRDADGFYNVEEFKLNNVVIPYSLTHPQRWKNVVFEKWGTLSIDQAPDFPIDPYWAGVKKLDAIDRTFESSGTSGRKFFAYQVDESKQVLHLQNKNKQSRDEKFTLQYNRPDDQTIIVSGVNASADSLYAVLKKVDKKYLLLEGRRKPIKL